MTKKEELEKNLSEYCSILESQGDVGLDEPLVDKDGYPRSDIDLVQVRQARHAIIRLQNDYADLMTKIEAGLKQHFKPLNQSDNEAPPETSGNVFNAEVPFATVDLVTTGSPADKSGLRVGDKILQFGSVVHSNFKNMSSIASVVKHSRNRSIRVHLNRGGLEISLPLTPREWDGQGLLGCKIVPLS